MKDIKYKDISILAGKYLSVILYRLYTILYNIHSTNNTNESESNTFLSEKILMSELKYTIAMKNFYADENNFENTLKQYNFENPYLNNIIKNNL